MWGVSVAPIVDNGQVADHGAHLQVAVTGHARTLVRADQRLFRRHQSVRLLHRIDGVTHVAADLVHQRGEPRLERVGVAASKRAINQVLETGGRGHAAAEQLLQIEIGTHRT